MALDNPRLRDVLKQINTGVMQLPDFQREWKWDDQRIRALISTVTLDYPLGVVMTLETGGSSSFRTRPLDGAEHAKGVEPSLLLLDGQQRLTSLFQALYLNRPVQTTDSRKADIERWYYIDIAKAVGVSTDRDDAVIAVPVEKKLRSDFARRVDLDLSDIAAECAAGYFPLHIIFDDDRVAEWQQTFVEADRENWKLWRGFNTNVIQPVLSFLVPMIRLPADTTTDAVCSVFERVNTGGVPLNVFELLTATYAGDRAYTTQHGKHYRLLEEWQTMKKSLSDGYPVFGGQEKDLEDGLSSSDFLQAVTLVRTWNRKQQHPSAGVACKRRDLLELPLAEFGRLAPQLRDAFEWVGGFLTNQCIVHSADLPYRSQLIPLAAMRAILGDRTDEPEMLDRITRWYWCGVLGEMYSGSTESRLPRDLEQLIAWTDPDAPEPDTCTEANPVPDRLRTLSTRNSAAYKGIIALLVKQGAWDWYFNDGPLTPATLLQHAVDIRQIFPKSWFAQHSKGDLRASSIVNKTPLSFRASRNMNVSPSRYLPTLAGESGTRDEWFDDIVATHLIDPTSLRTDDFESFYEDRATQLWKLVNEAMGRSTVAADLVEQ